MYNKNGEDIISDRMKIIYICIFILFLLVIIRLWHLQILKGSYYNLLSKKNRIRFEDIYTPRGIIYDRYLRIVAQNLPGYAIGIIREDCYKENQCENSIKKVAYLINRDTDELMNMFNLGKKKGVKPFNPIIILRDLSFEDICKIDVRLSELPGVVIIPHPMRVYPFGKIGAHVLGYVGEPSEKDLIKFPYLKLGDIVGKAGLERVFEKDLRGIKGKKKLEVDAWGRILSEKVVERGKQGKPLRLTLDFDLETYIYKQMENKAGACVVMEPFSGDILALVSVPSFDPTKLSKGLSKKEWIKLVSNKFHPLQNRAISSAYPPGSVFKLVVAMLAMNEIKDIKKHREYCPGFYKLGNRVFRCWKKWGHGWVNFKEAIKQSCDVYFYKLGEKLGIDGIANFAKQCGLGKRTGIKLLGENSGLIPTREWKLKRFHVPWQKGETLNVSIGQGYVLVTPIQIARLICSIVNGGKILKPKIIYGERTYLQGKLPVRQTYLNELKKIMVATVEERYGTATILKTKGIVIGAKTGTAQVISIKSDEDRGKDVEEISYEKRDHAWMASFAIKGNRCYVIVCLVEHGGHGASGAGPIVRDVIRYLFSPKYNSRDY
ncbi:penicillin-binding protein 2 [Desulfothermus naphthae]